MRKKIKRILLVGLVACSSCTIAFAGVSKSEYFCVLKKIQQLPAHAQVIKKLSVLDADKSLFSVLKRQGVTLFGGLKQYGNGFVTQYGESLEVFEGDFSNAGKKEYLLLTTAGSMGVNTIAAVYQMNDQGYLTPLGFDKVVLSNFTGLSEMSGFHLFAATPFAYVKSHKTYFRFLDVPGRGQGYDLSTLRVVTYLWQGKSFAKVSSVKGSNLSVGCQVKG